MRESSARIVRLGAAVGFGLLLQARSAPAQVPVRCEATVQGDRRVEEVYDNYRDQVFAVQISTRQDACAKVSFDLVVTETLFDGEEITSTQSEWRKVQPGQEPAFKLKFRMARDSSLVHWEIKYRSCEVCAT